MFFAQTFEWVKAFPQVEPHCIEVIFLIEILHPTIRTALSVGNHVLFLLLLIRTPCFLCGSSPLDSPFHRFPGAQSLFTKGLLISSSINSFTMAQPSRCMSTDLTPD